MAGLFVNLNNKGAGKKIELFYRSKIESAMTMALVECLRQLTISTPVDTGRARWGWFVTVGSPSTEIPPEGHYSIPDVTSRANVSVSADVTAYIANNVPYIVELNDGSSKQQPARFAERSAASAQNAVMRYLKSKG